MGAYLSEPIVEKISSNEGNEYIGVGASSMQGWRISQEDAHNCILNFDKHTSFFAVYDGHGGAEVATYCAEKLPEFLKNLKSYKDGDFEQALKDAFLGFDATLLEEDVIDTLKKLAGEKNPDKDSEICDEEEEEDLAELCQEGTLPLDQVLEKYKGVAAAAAAVVTPKCSQINKLKEECGGPSGSGSKPVSPFLRARRALHATDDEKASNEGLSCSSTSTDNEQKVNIQQKGSDIDGDDSIVSSSSGKNESQLDSVSKMDEKSNEAICSSKSNGGSGVGSASKACPDSSSANPKSSSEKPASSSSVTKVQNGDVTSYQESKISTNSTIKSDNVISSSITSSAALSSSVSSKQENGEVSSNSSVAVSTKPNIGISSTNEKIKKPAIDEDDSSSDDDADFQAAEDDENSSTEDGEEEPMDDSDDENEELEEDEEGVLDDDSAFCTNMIEESGKDSGCTAVLALLHGRDLYVANAGDSRCVVSRNGKALEMSIDHKPEDEEEYARIYKAGGKVTLDGRVNGGLNLSRAIGDHAYKMNKDLPPEKQMISAFPDVRKIIISPDDDFMVLACDGVWNFMSSDEVVEFVKKRFDEGRENVSEICEELFDNCLAPNTLGDGTGCDNMTAVIIRFKPKILELPTRISIESEALPLTTSNSSKKRAASPSNDENEDNNDSSIIEKQKPIIKRLKTDNNETKTGTIKTTTSSSIKSTTNKMDNIDEDNDDDPMSTTTTTLETSNNLTKSQPEQSTTTATTTL